MLHRLPLLFAALAIAISGAAVAQPLPSEAPVPPPPTPATDPSPAPPASDELEVTGRVVNAFGRPLAGATVRLEAAPQRRTTSDVKGTFKLRAPLGATLIIEASGFEVGLAAVTGATVDEIVLLAPQEETIEIHGDAPPPAPGAAVLDRAELQRVPGAGSDIVKALTAMPGVVNLQVPLGYSGVTIRGSSPQDSKVFVDGFEIPVLFHDIGFRANLPAESIASLDYIPGGFDVAYGRASSGIVSVATRGGADQGSAQAEISALDGGVLAQGPIGEDTRYMIALRRSTIDFVLPAFVPDDAEFSFVTVPNYWDGQLRLDHQLSSKWRASLSAIGSTDVLSLYVSRQEADSKRFSQEYGFVRVTATAKYADGPWSATLALSGMHAELSSKMGLMQHVNLATPSVTPRGELARSFKGKGLVRDVVVRAGAEASITRSRLDIAIPLEPRDGEPDEWEDDSEVETRFDGKFWLPNFAGWTAATASVGPRVRATMGLRVDSFGRNDEVAFQPRADVTVKLNDDWSLLASGGAFHRPPEFQSELIESKNLKSERSYQSIGGVRYEPREGIRVQASGYYYDRDKLITRRDDDSLGNDGKGHTLGGELLATYRDDAWFAWLAYSYSRSRRVDQPGDMERMFSYDQPHSLNAAASWKLGKWQLGARFQIYSGLPYTPVNGAIFDSDRDKYEPTYGDPNSGRAPFHHQLDLRVDRSWKWGPVAMTGFLDVQNVYMNDSPITYEYSYDYSERAAIRSIPILPSLGLRGVL
jgi:TonB-dependent Receptor Plug Domain